MNGSRLINKNIVGERRTSMRHEPEMWDAITEICERERLTLGQLIQRIDAKRRAGGRTSAVRVFVLNYFREAATDRGHASAGHGGLGK